MFKHLTFIFAVIFLAGFSPKAFADSTQVIRDAIVPSLAAGQPAPDFTLVNQAGKETALKDFRGHWVVLYFYPKDFSKGCTIEAHNFQRDSALYARANAVILGVSMDSAASHQGFCDKEGLRFKLLADTAGKVSALYNSVKEWDGRRMSARNTFIINPKGNLARVFLGVKPDVHSAEVLQALRELGTKR